MGPTWDSQRGAPTRLQRAPSLKISRQQSDESAAAGVAIRQPPNVQRRSLQAMSLCHRNDAPARAVLGEPARRLFCKRRDIIALSAHVASCGLSEPAFAMALARRLPPGRARRLAIARALEAGSC